MFLLLNISTYVIKQDELSSVCTRKQNALVLYQWKLYFICFNIWYNQFCCMVVKYGVSAIPLIPKLTHFFNWFLRCALSTGGHRTRVAAVTLDNMAEDAVAASASLWQIPTVSVRYCGPAFVSWLSMLWDTLTRNSELQWFGISPQFRLKLSRGDEGVGHVCFPGDESVGRP